MCSWTLGFLGASSSASPGERHSTHTCRSIQWLVMPPISGQLHDGFRYESPRGSANLVSGLPQAVDMGKGLPECVRSVVLNQSKNDFNKPV